MANGLKMIKNDGQDDDDDAQDNAAYIDPLDVRRPS